MVWWERLLWSCRGKTSTSTPFSGTLAVLVMVILYAGYWRTLHNMQEWCWLLRLDVWIFGYRFYELMDMFVEEILWWMMWGGCLIWLTYATWGVRRGIFTEAWNGDGEEWIDKKIRIGVLVPCRFRVVFLVDRNMVLSEMLTNLRWPICWELGSLGFLVKMGLAIMSSLCGRCKHYRPARVI